jgi:hypothetical protein
MTTMVTIIGGSNKLKWSKDWILIKVKWTHNIVSTVNIKIMVMDLVLFSCEERVKGFNSKNNLLKTCFEC